MMLEIEIDNNNIKEIALKDLRGLMGIVNQDQYYLMILYIIILIGKTNSTKEEIIAAAKIANAHNFILETENGI